ncbi:N-acetylneuraminate synthase family protein [Alphaproteobacteria bacterium]|nr:N-acetylneuraminate synthase family protein [Alphaproteobacteria bacterium]
MNPLNEVNHQFNFNDLFVLDIANNHQGSVDHAKLIINEHKAVVAENRIRAGVKFQFRDLPNFIHPSQQKQSDNKHVPRFLSTLLDWKDFKALKDFVKEAGLLSICTPFDEVSVGKIIEMGFDVLKIASCSAKDWPLLEAAADANLPILASTGGLLIEEVDQLVSFLEHRGCDFALMHCVSIYPTPDEECNLNTISTFRKRYPNRVIGWSTHENPDDTAPVQIARALGAQMYERHIGVQTAKHQLNAYSSSPSQLDKWIKAKVKADLLIGDGSRSQISSEEKQAIDGLKRGVFVSKFIQSNTDITEENTYYAFPCNPDGISSGEWKNDFTTSLSLKKDDPILKSYYPRSEDLEQKVLKKAIHDVRARLNLTNITLSPHFTVEFSHHYGICNFNSVGTVMVNVINRQYCKKILVQLPNQQHPLHFHKLKEETFLVLSGRLHCELDGKEYILDPGDTLLVLPGVWHRFWSSEGAIFEEISTTAISGDSVYRDPKINKMETVQRKTIVDHWGRFQIQEQLRNVNLPSDLVEL